MPDLDSEHRLMIRGYEVVVRTGPDHVHITCPDLPQLAVQGDTLSDALALTEDMIDAILAGRLGKPEGSA